MAHPSYYPLTPTITTTTLKPACSALPLQT